MGSTGIYLPKYPIKQIWLRSETFNTANVYDETVCFYNTQESRKNMKKGPIFNVVYIAEKSYHATIIAQACP